MCWSVRRHASLSIFSGAGVVCWECVAGVAAVSWHIHISMAMEMQSRHRGSEFQSSAGFWAEVSQCGAACPNMLLAFFSSGRLFFSFSK